MQPYFLSLLKHVIMNVKLTVVVVLSVIVLFFACKKNVPAPTILQVTQADIDSITGMYIGITSGDSIVTAADGTQTINSFSWPDTLKITSPDTTNIIVVSKYYTVDYPYSDALTQYDSVTTLQYEALGNNGYVLYNTVLTDTANNVNHVVINTQYSYVKNLVTNVYLYKRQQ